jgi:hypothetical protein
MQFSDEVVWTASDFLFAAVLIGVTGGLFELAVRLSRNVAYRIAAALALAGTFLLVWINGAVGIIGSEQNDANLFYLGVLSVGAAGAFVSAGRAAGMSRTLVAMTCVQTLIGGAAFLGGWGGDGPGWPRDIILLTGFFDAIFLIAAALFHRASRDGA